MPAPLADTLRHRRVAAMIADAELIRDHPAGDERTDAGRRLLGEALHEFSLHRISEQERRRLFEILSFAVDRDAVSSCCGPVALLEGLTREPLPQPPPDA